MGCSARMCSDYFRIGGQLFRLEVYPAGYTADTRKHMSVFLTTPGSMLANQVFYEISILDQVCPGHSHRCTPVCAISLRSVAGRVRVGLRAICQL